jgi:hypothetical protein
MRRTAPPAITARTYRHFATVTLALTTMVAFFANGEKQQAIAAEAVASEPSPAPLAKAKERSLQPPSTPAPVNSGTWGSDDSSSFGQPTFVASATGAGWLPGALGSDRTARALGASLPREGEEPASYEGSEPATPTATQIAAVAAASRLRSGSAGRE